MSDEKPDALMIIANVLVETNGLPSFSQAQAVAAALIKAGLLAE
jgi:hypothetical protein